MSKKIVYLYLNGDRQNPNTSAVQRHLARHIDEINRSFYVKTTLVTSKNLAEVKKRGVKKLPTLVCEGRFHLGAQEILLRLGPTTAKKEEPSVFNYHLKILDEGDDDDEDSPDKRQGYLMKKAAQLQKSREESLAALTKGRRQNRKKFGDSVSGNEDQRFLQAAGRDEEDLEDFEDRGDILLEDYYNKEADAFGRRHRNTRR